MKVFFIQMECGLLMMNQMKKIVVPFFTDLFYQPDLDDLRITIIPWLFPTIDQVRFDDTIRSVSLDKVKSALLYWWFESSWA